MSLSALLDRLQGVRQAQGRSFDGLRRAQSSVTITQENETRTLPLTLSGTGGFEGILRDGGGNPLPYTRVTCNVGLELATDSHGHFTASQVSLGTWGLFARGEGSHRSGSRTVILTIADQVVKQRNALTLSQEAALRLAPDVQTVADGRKLNLVVNRGSGHAWRGGLGRIRVGIT